MSIEVEVLEKEIPVNTPPYPFELQTSLNYSMLPSQKVILDIHSKASSVVHERESTIVLNIFVSVLEIILLHTVVLLNATDVVKEVAICHSDFLCIHKQFEKVPDEISSVFEEISQMMQIAEWQKE
ncbi:hypothetical protein FRX31_007155 [Thalictrum thalictroides]|uniref:Uncharacterized protein n=1 Tax=Thalictrum thalictroides TaxID=46969 RepID=A0A7J6X3A0_THATH|nr:hypothetical protein FRX31_007155 [Thalictrum thalictroides]